MTENSYDIRRLIQDLTARSATEQMRAAQRLRELLQRISRGELDQQALREEFMRFTSEETSRYLHDLVGLGLKFYDALLELSGTYNDRFFEQVLGAATGGGSTASAPRAAPPQRAQMELHAPVGQDATGSFVVENKRAETAEITFLVSEFAGGAADTAPFRPPLQLQPPRFTLGPGEQRVVTLRLPLLADLFAPGQLYAATIVVRGYDELVLDLSVRVEAPPDAAGVSFRPATSETRADEPSSGRDRMMVGDDLTRLQGIGPRYAERLREAGITTFAELAAVDDRVLTEVLGSSVLHRVKRDEWLTQASLAAVGDEEGLKTLRENLLAHRASKRDGR